MCSAKIQSKHRIAHFEEPTSLEVWIGISSDFIVRLLPYGVTRPKTVFGVSPFTHPDEKFSGLASDIAVHPERVA